MMGPLFERNVSLNINTIDMQENKSERKMELPDDSGHPTYKTELPDDSGEKMPEAAIPLNKTPDYGEKPSNDSPNDSAKIASLEENPYRDDTGKNYRIGKDLRPNIEYKLNGYIYKTDSSARIVSAMGKLHLKNREGRLPIKDSIEDIGKGDEKKGDDRGHLIGDQFDGSNGLENMIPQDANINRNDFKNFENELRKEVVNGKTVFVKIEPLYDGDSRRPTDIVVTHSIDGDESIRVFPNDQEAQK